MKGIDYAWGDPGVTAMKQAGVEFVCRYVSTPGNGKNLRADEAKRLLDAGIAIVVVFETTAGRALDGRDAGRMDAISARRQVFDVGLGDMPIYFAVDFDANESQQPAISAYLQGAAAELGRERVGVYGGYHVVKRCLDAGVCKYGWQTYAWSGGLWDDRAHIQQFLNGQRLNGCAIDYDRSMADDFGQWPRPKTTTKTEVFMFPEWFIPWLRWYMLDRDPDTRPAGAPTPEPEWAWKVVGAVANVHMLLGAPVKYQGWRDWFLVEQQKTPKPENLPSPIPDQWWDAAKVDHAALATFAARAQDQAVQIEAAKTAQALAQVDVLKQQLAAAKAALEQAKQTGAAELAELRARVGEAKRHLQEAQAALT